MTLKRIPIEERFWKFVEPMTEGNGCWEWSGGLSNPGYGKLEVPIAPCKPRAILAHRLSYEMHYGNIPDASFVLHRCDNPSCVNPKHLFLGSQGDNVRDCVAKGRNRNGDRTQAAEITRAYHASRSACKLGHPLDGINATNGTRFCQACSREAKRRYKQRIRQAR